MKLATTTGDFNYYCPDYESKIEALFKSGFKYIDISFFEIDTLDALRQDDWEDYFKRLRERAEALGLSFVQSHSPFIIFGTQLEPEHIELTRRSVVATGILGAENIVVHPMAYSKEGNRAFYENFFPAMEKYGVNVLVENTGNTLTGDEKPDRLYTGRQMRDLIEYINHPLFHACWDTGHANLEGHQRQDILDLGEHLRAIHFNDNKGLRDDHMIPFCGSLKIDEVMTALKDINYDGYFTFECSNMKGPSPKRVQRRATGNKNALTAVSLELKIMEEKLLYEVGKYILNHYGLFEE